MTPRTIWRAVIVLNVLNFFAFWYGDLMLGGSALNGKVEAGRYYLGEHGTYVEVPKATYDYSMIHSATVFATMIAALAASIALSRMKDPLLTRRNKKRDVVGVVAIVVVASLAAAIAGPNAVLWVLPVMFIALIA